MKKLILLLLLSFILSGCAPSAPQETTAPGMQTENNSTETVPQVIPVPIKPEMTKIAVYVPNENLDGFDILELEGEQLTFLEAMYMAGVLPEDVMINSVTWREDTMTVDFNTAFRDLICTMGTTGERMLMGSVVNTLLQMHEMQYIIITVEGQVLESGHVIYDSPMGFFE